MTTRIAIWLFLIIGIAISLDIYMGWGGSLIAARRGVDLIQSVAIWR